MLQVGKCRLRIIWIFFLIYSLPNFLFGSFDTPRQGKLPLYTKVELANFPNAYNPSLIKTDYGLLLTFRNHPDPKQLWFSDIGIVVLDEYLRPISTPELLKTRSAYSITPSQSEDARIFSHNGHLYVIYNDNTEVINATPKQRRDMFITEVIYENNHFVCLEPKKLIYPEKLAKNTWEKNWTPFEWNNTLYLIYSISPFEVIRPDLDTGICEQVCISSPKIDWKHGSLRGGTPALLLDGEYFAFFHAQGFLRSEQRHGSSVWNTPRIHYLMGAYTFTAEPPFVLTSMTPNPIIEKEFYTMENIEKKVIYPGGFVVEGSKMHIAYGRDDKEIWLITYDKDYVKSLLRPVQ